jgi:membrane-bound metal-dependent hydrolase YbcI (DUF457 family)
MFIFAHVFAGVLLGLGFWHLTNDRRAVPVCIIGSILPDLIDKSLGLLFPAVLGGGRTVFHSLMIVGLLLVICVLLFLFRSRVVLLGLGFACALFLHQILDEMWMLPANWFYPLLGPFQGQMIPEYIGIYFWLEITNPSEWMFMIASVVILAESYRDRIPVTPDSVPDSLKTCIYPLVVVMLLIMGFYLVIAGFMSTAYTIITPSYYQTSSVLAGVLALCGAVIMYVRQKDVRICDPHSF